MSTRKYDWKRIRELWEGGQDASVIAMSCDMPSKQRINQVRKQQGWERETRAVATVNNQFTIPKDLSIEKQLFLRYLSDGNSYRLASARAGIDESTSRRWREHDDFARLADLARSGKAVEYMDVLTDAATQDPKWAAYMLERHPLTRDDYAKQEGTTYKGNTFNVLGHISTGIHRDP